MPCTTALLVGICFAIPSVAGQTATNFPYLSPTPFINNPQNGNFTWPTGSTGVFNQGEPMGITWQSPYTLVNIYYIWNQTVGAPIESQCQIATGRPGNVAYQWTVDCALPPNCGTNICESYSTKAPFVLRIVDANGNLTEVDDGGFWSREFWIQPTPSSSSAMSATSSTTSTEPTFSTISTTSSNSTSSNLPLMTTSAVPTTTPNPSKNNVAIGIGVGVGVGTMLLLGAIAAFFLWRRYSRKTENKDTHLPPSYPDSNPSGQQKLEYYKPQSPLPFNTSVLPNATSLAEAPSQSLQELEARDFS